MSVEQHTFSTTASAIYSGAAELCPGTMSAFWKRRLSASYYNVWEVAIASFIPSFWITSPRLPHQHPPILPKSLLHDNHSFYLVQAKKVFQADMAQNLTDRCHTLGGSGGV